MTNEEIEEKFKTIEESSNKLSELIDTIQNAMKTEKENNENSIKEVNDKLTKISDNNANLLKSFQAALGKKQAGDNNNPTLEKILGGFKKQ